MGAYLPVFADLTEGNCNELKVAASLKLPKGSIVALDRGYIDYGLCQLAAMSSPMGSLR